LKCQVSSIEQYVEAVVEQCGYRLEVVAAHLEAGMQQITPLLNSGMLQQKSNLDALDHEAVVRRDLGLDLRLRREWIRILMPTFVLAHCLHLQPPIRGHQPDLRSALNKSSLKSIRKLCQDDAELEDLLAFVNYIVTEEDADGGEDGLEDEDDSE
jgi:hypothetical protein